MYNDSLFSRYVCEQKGSFFMKANMNILYICGFIVKLLPFDFVWLVKGHDLNFVFK